MMKQVKDYKDFVYDPSSNGIINTNLSEYEAYKAKKESLIKKAKEQKALGERVESLESDINNIKSDIDEIKSLLGSIARKL